MHTWSNYTVMVVEDSLTQRVHLIRLLKELGFGRVLAATDGVEAIRLLKEVASEPLYLVITDLDMPGMDGIELTQRITDAAYAQHIIVTSARDPRLLEVVESMSAEDAKLPLLGTLLKPIKRESLINLIDRAPERSSETKFDAKHISFTLDELELALNQKQFLPYYQPKVAISSGQVVGAEALARWQHPVQGIVSPFFFIPVLEGTPLMAKLTLLLIEQVLRDMAAWRSSELSINVSINLSAENLGDRGFIDRITDLVASYEVPPSSLTWEVTETTVMNNLSSCLANLARLRLKGYGLAMDDYGIGYSSMQQLSRCPFTELKIDRAFVDGAAERPNRRAILETSIDMGVKLTVTTVAEGVESPSDWHLLRDLACDLAQGFLIAKPMRADDLPPWINANRARLASLAY